MRTEICRRLGIEVPIFGLSAWPQVVAALTNAGGVGVLAGTPHDPEHLAAALDWIDAEVGGRPYGVDLLFPAHMDDGDVEDLAATIPEEHRRFVESLAERFAIPTETADTDYRPTEGKVHTHKRARERVEIALSHPVALLVSALGPPPPDIAEAAHAKGVLLGGLVGHPRHAVKQIEAGVDIVIAVGTEAGGHVGSISTFTLVPQVVDAVGQTPVLAAGGIGTGRHVAASLALGAAGVWTGSIWLTTYESEIEEALKDKLLAAGSEDAVITRAHSGRMVRHLRSPWIDAWAAPDAAPPLQPPLQGLLVRDVVARIAQSGLEAEVMGISVGQVVGLMNARHSVSDVVADLVSGCDDALRGLNALEET
jgi:NAD(P)H-dependent flavin oxidoreductase YrpB (nitropropane dioxygenase family)